jgi:oligosaccharide repeat unit polymerase
MKIFSYLLVVLSSLLFLLIGGLNGNTILLGGIVLYGLSILGGFVLNRNLVFFEPIVLFNFFTMGSFIAIVYYFNVGFYKSEYITLTSFSQDIDVLFLKVTYFCLLGLVMTNLGYFIFRKKMEIHIKQESNISDFSFKIGIVLFLVLCYANFFYNVWIFAGGNVFNYLSNVSIRAYEFESSGTTIMYNFGFIAVYLYLYLCLKRNKFTFRFYSVLLSIIIIKFSMGRLLHTINFALSVFVIQYFYHYQVLRKKHYLYVGGLLGLIGLGVFMYFLRVLSSLAFNNMVNKSFFDQMTEFFKLESLFKFLIEKGNIPNIPVLMKIIDSWESDIGFYMGKSYFTWLYNVLPSTIRPVDYQTSFVIKNRWYSALLGGGSIPPTGIGEMYLNFGLFGVIFGMFFFGVLMAYTYNLLNKFNNIWYLMIYSQILVYFFAIYPKGEFDNMSLFYILPFIATYIFLLFLSKIFSKTKI